MEKDVKLLIVPDVHGRLFWKEPVMDVLENSDAEIVFLGDYLDVYNGQFDPIAGKAVNSDSAVEYFKEIVSLKEKYGDRITLLVGNHDCGYISTTINTCRHDWYNHTDIREIFTRKNTLFNLYCEKEVNGRKFLFTHAYVNEMWINGMCKFLECDKAEILGKLDDILHSDLRNSKNKEYNFLVICLSCISWIRGGDDDFGSPVWADVNEAIYKKDGELKLKVCETYADFTNITGHNQLSGDKAINIENRLYDLDNRQCYYIDNNGDVRYLNNRGIVELTKE